jgi:hypothetical protein
MVIKHEKRAMKDRSNIRDDSYLFGGSWGLVPLICVKLGRLIRSK